jgi:hypothetical protein
MKVKATLLVVNVAGALAVVALAQAYDRQPIRVSGLKPDLWGNTYRSAQSDLTNRYDGLRTAWCTGVIMVGYRTSDSTWVAGKTRYWDKSACTGRTWRNKRYWLIYDAKGRCRECFKIYRLRGIGVGQLNG